MLGALGGREGRVLCVGNSLSYWNEGLHVHLARLGARTAHFYQGGASLSSLWREGGREKLSEEGWAAVVLQEDLPETSERAFLQAAGSWIPAVRATGGTPLLVAAWAYPRLPCSLEQISSAHQQASLAHSVAVAPVGTAFAVAEQMARQSGDVGALCLLCPDMEHPSIQGSYLQAVTVAAVLSGKKASSFLHSDWKPEVLEEGMADFLCEAADEAIVRWNAESHRLKGAQ